MRGFPKHTQRETEREREREREIVWEYNEFDISAFAEMILIKGKNAWLALFLP